MSSEADSQAVRGSSRRRWLIGVLIALPLLALGACATFYRGAPPEGPRVVDGKLRPCPDSPNCVCSYEDDPVAMVEPIEFVGDLTTTRERLLAVLEAQPRARVVTADADYIHAEFTTPVMRFVDDVEFYLDERARVIHLRSASRIGYSDLGANRDRVEALRALITNTATP